MQTNHRGILVVVGVFLLTSLALSGCGPKADAEPLLRDESSRGYEQGILPSLLTVDDAREAYEVWKTELLENCGEGVFRVRWSSDRPDATVSESMGYGMLLTVAQDDRLEFDGLWAYYQLAANQNGLMHWLRHGCDAHRETIYEEYPDDAASDADLDVAMALIMADCKWGGETYAPAARELLKAISDHEIIVEEESTVLLPGDNAWFVGQGGTCINPSYSTPAYYRVFADFVTDEGEQEKWTTLTHDTYAMLSANQNPNTGLLSNWSSLSGEQAACADVMHCPNEFAEDATRTAWRISTDYLWHGSGEAKAFLDTLTGWIASEGGTEGLQASYTLEGEEGSCSPPPGRFLTVGALASGAASSDAEMVNEFTEEMMALKDLDSREISLKAVYLLQLTGQFNSCGNRSPSP